MMSLLDQEELADKKKAQLKTFLDSQPPIDHGEKILEHWKALYDADMQSIVVETVTGPSDDNENPVFPCE